MQPQANMSTLVRAYDCNWLPRVRFIKKIQDWILIACLAGTRKVERGKLGAREKRIALRAPDFDFPSPFLFLVPATQARILKSEGIWKWILRFFTRQINPRFLGSYLDPPTPNPRLSRLPSI